MAAKEPTDVLDEDEQAALNAQTKHNEAIASHHVEILKRIVRLEKLGGTQDYAPTIMEALKAFGGTVNLSFLSQVLPDHKLLTQARNALIAKDLIKEVEIKNRKILNMVDHAA